MKKILIPTDFSDNAWDALTYAIRLYDDIPCSFYILNTFEINNTGMNTAIHSSATGKLYTILKEDSEKGLEKIENYLNEYLLNDKHEYKTISAFGDIVEVTKEIVTKKDINLVVMGTTGASGLKQTLLGSNTVKLIKHVKECPIIAVPKDYEFKEPELISFANDLKRPFKRADLNTLMELLLIHNLELEILHVKKERMLSDVQQKNIDLIMELVGDNVKYQEINLDMSIANSINNYTKNTQVDMVCLINYEHNFFERLTREPVIKKVGFHTQVPLLVINI